MEKNKKIELFENMPVKISILKMSLPIVLGMFIQILYSLVDIYFIGKTQDPNQLAAANLATPIFMIIMALSSIITTGAGSLISRKIGEKDLNTSDKAANNSLILSLIIYVILLIISILYIDGLVKILGGEASLIYNYTRSYVNILLNGSIFIILNSVLGQLLRSETDVRSSIIGMVIGILINIILDPIFIIYLNMGVKGAAWATIIGNIFSVIYYLYVYIKKDTIINFSFKKLVWDRHIVKDILFIGIPASLNQILISISLALTNNISKGYGSIYLASLGLASKFMMIATFIYIGFAAGSQPIIAYNYGAGNQKRLKETLLESYKIVFSIGLIIFLIFQFLSRDLIGLIIKDKQVIELSTKILYISAFSVLTQGLQMVSTSAVQGMGESKLALFLSVGRQGLLYIPLILIFNYYLGFFGLILAQPVSDLIMVTITLLLLYNLFKEDVDSKEELDV